jgi:hypothetical protein
MRYKTFAVAALVVVALAASLHAADLAGTWTAKFVTEVGDQEYTFTFAGAGAQLTGTAKSTLLGETKLTDLKVEGDKVTFVENASFQDMPLRITFTGTFSSADEIKFTRVVVEGTPEEAVAKRTKK